MKGVLKKPRVTKKSEIDTLFSLLIDLYAPSRLPPLHLPIFQRVQVPVLLFPTLLIAQARAWRGWKTPHSEQLKAVMEPIAAKGISWGGVRILIALCEAQFRPMRALELSLEGLFLAFLYEKIHHWPPSSEALELLKHDFRYLWKEKEKTDETGWVLAAAETPLPIGHRPRLLAPWVAGPTVKRWLLQKSVPEAEAELLALQLTTTLLGQKVRPIELQHWQDILDDIEIPSGGGRTMPLPAYLIDCILSAKDLDRQFEWGCLPTPATFVSTFPIDSQACARFGRKLSEAWTPREERSKNFPGPQIVYKGREITEPHTLQDQEEVPSAEDRAPEEKPSLQRQALFTCCLCQGQNVGPEIFLPHLENEHSVPASEVSVINGRKELRRKVTGELLARWREIRSEGPDQNPQS
jgi:hypothetical protein